MRLPFYLQPQIRDLLSRHVDALLSGKFDRQSLLADYNDSVRAQVEEFVALAERLDRALPFIEPSEQFITQLRLDLLQAVPQSPDSWLERIRRLPPRTQIAAGIGGATLTAGVVLIATRSMPNALDFWRNRTA